MRRNEKITALYERLSRDDDQQNDSNSIVYSTTQFDCCEAELPSASCGRLDITPDDIDVSDTATFVWAIR